MVLHGKILTAKAGVPPCFSNVSFLWNEFPCNCSKTNSKKQGWVLIQEFDPILPWKYTKTVLTAVLAESHLKKRVKNGGSFPSVMMYIGTSGESFSIRKSRSTNFCK